MAPSFGSTPSLVPPRKGTPEAIIAERLAALNARRTDAPASASPAPALENKSQTSAQTPTPTQNRESRSNPNPSPQTAVKSKPAPRKRAPRAKASPCPSNAPSSSCPVPDIERHARKCQICRHRDREAIESDFIEWRHPSRIDETYDISYDALYRHARATGLLQRRRENVALVVQKVLEEVDDVEKPSAFAILRAVRTLACLDQSGKWVEPSTTHIVVNSTTLPAPSADAISTTANEPAADSNRKAYEKLELDVTNTKQTPEVVSNRNKM